MRHTAVIFDKRKAYGEKLAGYLNTNKRFMFDVLAFHKENEFLEYCREDKPQLLMVDEEDLGIIGDVQCEEMIVLSESGTRVDGSTFYVHKYQSGENIEKDIFGFLSASGNIASIVTRKNRMHLISVYSPAPKTDGVFELLEYGKRLANSHRTLYLSLQTHSPLGGILNRSFDRDISDLMYHLESRGGNIGMLISGMTEHEGNLDILPPARGQSDIICMDGQRWKELLDHIEQDTDYEFVLLELGDSINGLYELLMQSDKVITITDKDRASLYRLAEYEESLRKEGMEAVLDKTVKAWEAKDE